MPSSRSADYNLSSYSNRRIHSPKSLALKGCSMPNTSPVPEGRRSKRIVATKESLPAWSSIYNETRHEFPAWWSTPRKRDSGSTGIFT